MLQATVWSMVPVLSPMELWSEIATELSSIVPEFIREIGLTSATNGRAPALSRDSNDAGHAFKEEVGWVYYDFCLRKRQ